MWSLVLTEGSGCRGLERVLRGRENLSNQRPPGDLDGASSCMALFVPLACQGCLATENGDMEERKASPLPFPSASCWSWACFLPSLCSELSCYKGVGHSPEEGGRPSPWVTSDVVSGILSKPAVGSLCPSDSYILPSSPYLNHVPRSSRPQAPTAWCPATVLLSFLLASSAPGSCGRSPLPQRRRASRHIKPSAPRVFCHQVSAGGLPRQLPRLLPDAHQLPCRQLPGVSGLLCWHDW